MDNWGRGVCPFVLTLLLVVFGAIPFHVPHFAPISPSFLLIAVFYWVLHRPDLMPVWGSFALAVIADIITGGFVGVGALVILIFQLVVDSQRRFLLAGSFWVLWLAFSILIGFAIALEWVLVWLLTDGVLEYSSAAFRVLVTTAFYPFVTWIFVLVQRTVLKV